MTEQENKTRVIIFTHRHYITGEVESFPTARLTDYILQAKDFIALTDAEIKGHDGHTILNTPFLDIARDKIEVIMPAQEVRLG